MFLGKNVIGNLVVDVENGDVLGRVNDLYVDPGLHLVEGLYLGAEGLFAGRVRLIAREAIKVIAQDVVLVHDGDALQTLETTPEAADWLRRDDLQGRRVNTPGGTRVGVIDDVILDDKARILGFALGRTFTKGPIERRRVLPRTAVLDPGDEDDLMTIDLARAEAQELSIVRDSFFHERVARVGDEETYFKSPYVTMAPEKEWYMHHGEKSPYVVTEMDQLRPGRFQSPYTTPEGGEVEAETFKSPYTTPEKA